MQYRRDVAEARRLRVQMQQERKAG
jgi:hypothetical protein